MGQAEKDDYEDQTNTEVLVDVDISALENAAQPHAADNEPPTMEAPTTQRKVDLKQSAKQAASTKPGGAQATSLPADTEPETLDPTFVVTLPGTVPEPKVPGPGAEGEPDTLKPPQTLGVRQIANASGPASVTKPGIGRVEAQAMDSILEETTSTSSRSAWLDSARKMLLNDPDEDTQSARDPVVSSTVSSSSPMPSPKPARSPVAASIPDIGAAEKEETQTEQRPRKKVTMVGIAPPANPVPVKIPPSPPAPAVSVSTDTRRAGPDLAIYVPPAVRDEKSFLPKLNINESETTDLITGAGAEKTDVDRPAVKAPIPLPSATKKEDQPFETQREPVVALPPPAKPFEAKPTDSPLETKREPPIDAKPATVKLDEAKKEEKLPRPPTSPIAIAAPPVGQRTMVSPVVTAPSNAPQPFAVSPSAAPKAKPEQKEPVQVGQKTLASQTAASLLMGATPAVKAPAPVAPSPPMKGGTARPPPMPPPIEEPEEKPQTVVMKGAPPVPPPAESSKPVAPIAAESSASAVPAVEPSTPALPDAPPMRAPSKSKLVLSPIDAMRRSPQLLAGVIAAGVLLLISGIGVGYIIRGSDPAPAPVSSVASASGDHAPPSTSTATAANDPPPKATGNATQAPPEPTTATTVALADPLDEPSTSGGSKNTAPANAKPKPQPHPHPVATPIVKPKTKPKPAPATPTPAATPAPAPPSTPKGFDPNSI